MWNVHRMLKMITNPVGYYIHMASFLKTSLKFMFVFISRYAGVENRRFKNYFVRFVSNLKIRLKTFNKLN
jgi:hypothetical protein